MNSCQRTFHVGYRPILMPNSAPPKGDPIYGGREEYGGRALFASGLGDRVAQRLKHTDGQHEGWLTDCLAAMAKMRKVTIVRGYGAFVSADHVEVEETTGSSQEKQAPRRSSPSRWPSSLRAHRAVGLAIGECLACGG
jgi:hypothetical protein